MPLRKHGRTVAVVQMLRAIGPLPHRRRKRLPQQQQPDAIRAAYYRDLLPFIHEMQAQFHAEREEIIRLLQDQRREEEAKSTARADATFREEAQRLVDRAARKAVAAFSPGKLAAVAAKFGAATDAWSRRQLDKQVRAAVGVPLSAIEKPVTAKLTEFAKENVQLIVTVGERYFERIRKDVNEAFESGMHPTTLAEQLIGRDDMSENDARRIARDQIGKLNAQMNEERQKAMGLEGYRWRGVLDNRERDEHRALEGQFFTWDDPPESGTDGERLPPGEPIQCRCYAEPDFSPVLADLND